ncbi:MAG: hypothetical protein HFJ80_05330 [Clostridiales bacterium]|nr:hypothetical protein [Clostridiales bacterium]
MNASGSRRRIRSLLMTTATFCAAALVIGGGAWGFADYQGGRYANVQDGYLLKRLDAQETYEVRLPAESSVPVEGNSSRRAAARTVTLTYDHSEKGRIHNWDIYRDEEDGRYTYHEETGQLVSIEYRVPSPEQRTARAAVSEETVRAFARQYLGVLVPRFEQYELVSCTFTGGEAGDPNGRYLLRFGVPVGEAFGAATIDLDCFSTGELQSVVFPQTAVYEEMTAQEKQTLAALMPSRQELESFALAQIQEKYEDRLISAEVRSVLLGKEDHSCTLYIALDVIASISESCPAGFFEQVVYPLA